jgi:ankyrin repeat protein
VNRTSYLNQINEEKGFVIWLSEVLSTHPPLPKRISEIGLFMGDDENILTEKRSSKKLWIGLSAAILLLIGMIGGSIYAFKQLDIATLMNEIEATSNLESTSPLIEAVINGDTEKINNLLEKGEEIDTQDYEGWTALHWAVKAIDAEASKLLLDAGADPNIEDYYGAVPLMTAAADGHLEIMQMLLDKGVNIDHQDYDGWTPLMYAVSSNQVDMVKALLKAGANKEIKNNEDYTALMLAIQRGNHEIINLLRNHK